MIKEAMEVSQDGFKIFASPWQQLHGWKIIMSGKAEITSKILWFMGTVFSKYVDAYKEQGIDIWGFTVENEPHGNNSSWEHALYTRRNDNFVKDYLGPQLEKTVKEMS